MKYNLNVNQKRALELGIVNINQAHIFDLLSCSQVWAKTEIVEGEVFYWVARQRICDELPIIALKPDTVYRHLKNLSNLGLIKYTTLGKKDLIQITKEGKSYYVGNRSELSKNSEIDPTKLGNRSEFCSEIDPTYKDTNIIINTNDYKKTYKKENLENHIPDTSKMVDTKSKISSELLGNSEQLEKDFESTWRYFFDEYKKSGKPAGSKSEAKNLFLKNLKKYKIEEIKQSIHNYVQDCVIKGYGFKHLTSFLSISKKHVEEWENGSENHQALLEIKSKPVNVVKNERGFESSKEKLDRNVKEYNNKTSAIFDEVFKNQESEDLRLN